MLVGFLTALEAESKTFKKNKGLLYNGDTYVVARCKVGAEAKDTALQLIEEGCDILISWGIAGGAKSDLKTGDLFIATSFKNVRSIEIRPVASVANGITDKLQTLRPKRGDILTVEKMILKSTEKKTLAQKYKISAIDMESAIIAQTAEKATIPYICIRSICDEINTDMPAFINNSLNRNGETVIWTALEGLALQPKKIIPLAKLGWKFHKALKTLRAAAQILTS